MKKSKILLSVLLTCSLFSQAYANSMRYIGFPQSEVAATENNMNWFLINAPNNNVFFKLLRYEMEKTSGISMEEIPRFLYNHFPLVISDNQAIKRCPLPASRCKPENFDQWEKIQRSDQLLAQDMLKLYTPYLDRNYETSIIGFAPEMLLSVQSKNQTMAVINRESIRVGDDAESEYLKWVSMSQWLALARLHQVFSSDGKALTECKTKRADVYLCDPYSNGSLYIASLALIAGSEECDACSTNEKLMLKIIAFDHILRTGKSEKTEKIVRFLTKELKPILKSESEDVRMLLDIYEVRNESPKRGLEL